ncbi:MAG: thioesterase family protein [Deltaproteobacteria bacterium]|nr:thioesterase family protein [Deltaproteobacteria bacterium]
MASSIATPLRRLLDRLDLQQVGDSTFAGTSGQGEGTLFGGFVAAQAVIAAGRTVGDRWLHSLHAYFLRPGRHGVPIHYMVTPLRDGRTFSTRQVVARQGDEAIFTLTADFTRTTDGLAHQQSAAPDAPRPESLPDWEDLRAELLGGAHLRRGDGALEVRVCDPDSPEPGVRLPPRRRVWMRPRGVLPEEAQVHAAVLVYATDRTFLRTAARHHGLGWRLGAGASLDHAVWLHQPVRFDDWILYASESPVCRGSRALLLGEMYNAAGVRIASVAQEGLLRPV